MDQFTLYYSIVMGWLNILLIVPSSVGLIYALISPNRRKWLGKGLIFGLPLALILSIIDYNFFAINICKNMSGGSIICAKELFSPTYIFYIINCIVIFSFIGPILGFFRKKLMREN